MRTFLISLFVVCNGWGQPLVRGARTYLIEGVDSRWVTPDRDGFIWVAGDKGTYRFDGKVALAGRELGLPMRANDWVEVTSDGSIWVLSGESLWRLEAGRFQMISGR